jgi:hypothetical protein
VDRPTATAEEENAMADGSNTTLIRKRNTDEYIVIVIFEFCR